MIPKNIAQVLFLSLSASLIVASHMPKISIADTYIKKISDPLKQEALRAVSKFTELSDGQQEEVVDAMNRLFLYYRGYRGSGQDLFFASRNTNIDLAKTKPEDLSESWISNAFPWQYPDKYVTKFFNAYSKDLRENILRDAAMNYSKLTSRYDDLIQSVRDPLKKEIIRKLFVESGCLSDLLQLSENKIILSLINRLIPKSVLLDDKFRLLFFAPENIDSAHVDLNDQSIKWEQDTFPENLPQNYVVSKFTVGSTNPISSILQDVVSKYAEK